MSRKLLVVLACLAAATLLTGGCGDEDDSAESKGKKPTVEPQRKPKPATRLESTPARQPQSRPARQPDPKPATRPASKPARGAETPPVVYTSESSPGSGLVRHYFGGTVLGRASKDCGVPVKLYVNSGHFYVGDKRLGERLQVSVDFVHASGKRRYTAAERKQGERLALEKLRAAPPHFLDANGERVKASLREETLCLDTGIHGTLTYPLTYVSPWGKIRIAAR